MRSFAGGAARAELRGRTCAGRAARADLRGAPRIEERTGRMEEREGRLRWEGMKDTKCERHNMRAYYALP